MSLTARQRLVRHVEAKIGARIEYAPWVHRDLAEAAVRGLLSFNGLMAVAQKVLDERYPADVPLVCDRDSPDPGPRLAAALRDCLAATRGSE